MACQLVRYQKNMTVVASNLEFKASYMRWGRGEPAVSVRAAASVIPHRPLNSFTNSGGKERHEERKHRPWRSDRSGIIINDRMPPADANRSDKQ